ncbi:MAG: MarR family winged helix-turn-helix transcriptional regulator [Desulfosarcinaceae bacterium]
MKPARKDGIPLGSSYGEQVLICLRKIMQAITLHSRSLVKQVGLTGPQLILLKAVAKSEGMPVGEIAKAISLSQATVTGILERMVKRGLVSRQRSERDKRQVLIRLTPAGEQILAQAPPLMQASFLKQLQHLEDWEQTMILSALQRLIHMMGAEEFEVAPILAPDPFDPMTESDNGVVPETSLARDTVTG